MHDLFDADINYLAVILGALAAQVLGFLWYGKLFYKPWVAARAIDPSEGENPGPAIYLVPLVCGVLIAYTLARLADMAGADSVGDCIAVAAFVWVGLAGTVQLMQINFSETRVKRVPTFLIEGGFQLTSFVIIGAIVGCFQ
jgi:prolipoprotein diacylglyceryltransferase